jgi:hypothetical protein
MYATAAARSDGLLLLCGGRNAEGTPLGDAFGLARHRDGRWEWAAAPGSMPVARYQHGAVFVGARLHISGGAVGGGRMVDDAASVAVLDTVRTALVVLACPACDLYNLCICCKHLMLQYDNGCEAQTVISCPDFAPARWGWKLLLHIGHLTGHVKALC